MRCPSCGISVEKDVQFCPNCGHNIDQASTITINSEDVLPSENVYGVLKKILIQPSASTVSYTHLTLPTICSV